MVVVVFVEDYFQLCGFVVIVQYVYGMGGEEIFFIFYFGLQCCQGGVIGQMIYLYVIGFLWVGFWIGQVCCLLWIIVE